MHAVTTSAVNPSENKQIITKRSKIFMMLSDVPTTLNRLKKQQRQALNKCA